MPADSGSPTAPAGRRGGWEVLFWGLGLVGALLPLFSPRVWSPSFTAEVEGLVPPWDLFRLLRQGLLLVSLLAIVYAVLIGARPYRPHRPGLALWLAALGFLLLSYASMAFGTEPGFHPAIVIVPGAITAAYLLGPLPLDEFIGLARRVLLVYVFGSIAAMVVAPAWAFEQSYDESLIGGATWRLHGLATHSNVLSPFLLAYLLIDLYSFRQSKGAWAGRSAAFACLVLTQSKSALAILFIVCFLRQFFLLLRERTVRRYFQLAVLTLLAGSAGLLLIIVLDVPGVIARNPSLTTLTGRTEIWRAALEIWRDNVWFGYGPDAFDIGASPDYFGTPLEERRFVVSAHNQFFQTLAVSGAVGVAGLLIYGTVLSVYAVRFFRATRGISICLVGALFLSGISEPSIDPYIVGGSTLFVHLLTFSVLLLAHHQASAGERAGVNTAPGEYLPRVRSAPGPALIGSVNGGSRGLSAIATGEHS